MSKFPTIPEFVRTPEEMSTALRAIKQSVEILAGLRQGQSLGAPQMFVQTTAPVATLNISYKTGDLWINTATNTVSFWNGTTWIPLSYT